VAALETVVRHASDSIDWIDRTGLLASDHAPLVRAPLLVQLDTPLPAGLRLHHKRGRSVLWRARAGALLYVVDGDASPEDLEAPVETAYGVSGTVSDPQGRFLPRRFAISAGNAAGHAVDLYRSVAGTRFRAAGGLRMSLARADGSPLPWALVEVTVTPPVGGAHRFVGQADARGELDLPLSRLPALTRDAPATGYPATLAVRAVPGASAGQAADPDTAVGVDLRDPFSGTPGPTGSLQVEPGRITRVSSPASDHLIVEAP